MKVGLRVILSVLGLFLVKPEIVTAKTTSLEFKESANKVVKRILNCKEPESSYYDQASRQIFVSHVNGKPHIKDNNGFISKHSLDDLKNTKVSEWAKGLHAPKGLRSFAGTLWVADIDRVVGFDIKTGKQTKVVKIAEAKMLNDLTVDSEGVIYVSDTLGSAIYKIKNGKVTLMMKGKTLGSPNGLLVKAGKLYVVGWGYATGFDWKASTKGMAYEIDPKTMRIRRLYKKGLGNLDGLEYSVNGEYLISNWVSGEIYSVTESGKMSVVYDGIKGPADIGYVADKELLLIPRMGENAVDVVQM